MYGRYGLFGVNEVCDVCVLLFLLLPLFLLALPVLSLVSRRVLSLSPLLLLQEALVDALLAVEVALLADECVYGGVEAEGAAVEWLDGLRGDAGGLCAPVGALSLAIREHRARATVL